MKYRLYVGTCARDVLYADAQQYAYGLHAYELDSHGKNGEMILVYNQCLDPAFIRISGRTLYAGCEFTDNAYFAAYDINQDDGSLRLKNTLSVPGSGLCEINYFGNHLFGAEFWSGNVISCSLKEDGSIGEMKSYIQHVGSSIHPVRQKSPHVHSVYPDRSGRFLLACDLGCDRVYCYHINDDSTLTPNELCPYITVPAGKGPRHLVFSKDNRFAFLNTEITDEVFTIRFNEETGEMTLLGCVSGQYPEFTGLSKIAEIILSPDGNFLYTTHRVADYISQYSIDHETGAVKRIAQYESFGKGPRSISISPDGRLMAVANRESNKVVVLNVNSQDGSLGEKTWESIVPEPCCVCWA